VSFDPQLRLGYQPAALLIGRSTLSALSCRQGSFSYFKIK
jgi:hypothetical protein